MLNWVNTEMSKFLNHLHFAGVPSWYPRQRSLALHGSLMLYFYMATKMVVFNCFTPHEGGILFSVMSVCVFGCLLTVHMITPSPFDI